VGGEPEQAEERRRRPWSATDACRTWHCRKRAVRPPSSGLAPRLPLMMQGSTIEYRTGSTVQDGTVQYASGVQTVQSLCPCLACAGTASEELEAQRKATEEAKGALAQAQEDGGEGAAGAQANEVRAAAMLKEEAGTGRARNADVAAAKEEIRAAQECAEAQSERIRR